MSAVRVMLFACVLGCFIMASGSASAYELWGWWPLDEGQGEVAKDMSGNGNDGTIVNSASGDWVEDPVRGTVLSSAGGASGLVVRTGILPVMTLENDFTWAFWANQDAGLTPLNHIVLGNRRSAEDIEFVPRQFIKFTPTQFEWHMNGAAAGNLDYDDFVAGEWAHHAIVKTADQLAYYRDAVVSGESTLTAGMTESFPLLFFGDGARAGENWVGMLSDVRLASTAMTADEVADVMAGKGPVNTQAASPAPADQAEDIPRDHTPLQWKPGEFAQTHDVFVGGDAEDVDRATVANPLSTTVYAGLDVNSVTLDRLDFSQTYHWRVDEVNAPANPGVFKGTVWSFTAEPEAIPVMAVDVSASGADDGMGAEKTVDGSGLDALGQHSTNLTDMWQVTSPQPGEAWIAYDFGEVRRLHEMQVWNHNSQTEMILGYGIKEAVIESTQDGTIWTEHKTIEIAQASSLDSYTGVTIALDGVVARSLRLRAMSNWSQLGFQTYGLSEVRFSAIPTVARNPQPVAGAVDVAPQTTLAWRAGREADRHEILMGAGPDAMEVLALVDAPSHEVSLDMDQTYYWQVQEVNEAATPAVWEGGLWQFTTAPHIVVDDFEMYSDQEGERIYEFWADGYDNPGENGAVVGNGDDPETNTVYDGTQSMPLAYGAGGVNLSHTTRTFDAPIPVNQHGIQSLSLQFYGTGSNIAGQLYLEINGQRVADYPGAQAELLEPQWHAWILDLTTTSVTQIDSLTLGIAGGSGVLYLDAIRLYARAAEMIEPAEPDAQDRVAYYPFDGDAADAAGDHHGTLNNNPIFVAGNQGQAISFSGTEYVSVPYAASLGLNSFTVSSWINVTDLEGNRGIIGTRFDGNFTFDLKVDLGRVHGDIGNGSAWLNTAPDPQADVRPDLWQHIAYTVDDDTDTGVLYLNGLAIGSVSFDGVPLFMQEGQEMRIGLSYGEEYMRGQIDDLAIYNRALSPGEIAGLAGRSGVIYRPFE